MHTHPTPATIKGALYLEVVRYNTDNPDSPMPLDVFNLINVAIKSANDQHEALKASMELENV